VTHVFTAGSAEEAGLSAGDIIIAINNLKVSKASVEKVATSYEKGTTLLIHAFRRDELYQFKLTLKQAELTTCYLQLNSKADNKQTTMQNQWLSLNE